MKRLYRSFLTLLGRLCWYVDPKEPPFNKPLPIAMPKPIPYSKPKGAL